MKQNTDALWFYIYDAIVEWNSTTENADGKNVLSEAQENSMAHFLNSHALNDMYELELLV